MQGQNICVCERVTQSKRERERESTHACYADGPSFNPRQAQLKVLVDGDVEDFCLRTPASQ